MNPWVFGFLFHLVLPQWRSIRVWRKIRTSQLPEEFYVARIPLACHELIPKDVQFQAIQRGHNAIYLLSACRFDPNQRLHGDSLDSLRSSSLPSNLFRQRKNPIDGGGGQTDLGDGGGGGGLLLAKGEGHGGGRVGGGRAGEESKGSALHGCYLGNKGLSKWVDTDGESLERRRGTDEQADNRG